MRKLTLAVVALFSLPLALEAQVGFHPAMQPSRVSEREYNVALADFDGGSALAFQWREALGTPRTQFTADVALLDFDGAFGDQGGFSLGGSFHYQLAQASAQLPFDMVLGAGLGLTKFDNGNVLRFPVGVAVGHRFPLEGNFAITPFVHPRLSFDRTKIETVGGNATDTEMNLDLEIGGSFEINRQMQLRLAATLGDSDAIGLGFVWLPRGLR